MMRKKWIKSFGGAEMREEESGSENE